MKDIMPVLAAASLLVSSQILAQIYVGGPQGSSMAASFMVGNSMLKNAYAKSGVGDSASAAFSRSAGVKPQSAGSSMALLSFVPSPGISARVRESVIDSAIKTDPSLDRAKLEEGFANNQVLKSFAELLANYGYSSTNLADVMTAYYVVCWEVVNGTDASGNSGGISAVNAQLKGALLANLNFQRLPDTDKQQVAEVMAYQTVIVASAKNELIKRGDQAGLQRLRQSVRQGVLQMGVDLSRLKLTSQGFVPAS
jgi:hypothetical protein